MKAKFAILALSALTIGGAVLVSTASAKTKTPKPKVTKKAPEKKIVGPALNFTMKSLDGKDVDLSKYQGKTVLMVNTASKCGYTPQYEGLEALYKKYNDKGFVILGFPANEFGGQEPGTDAEIGEFCKKNYGVTFPMFSKVVVKGEGKCPLYQYLTQNAPTTGEVGWNFEKFLIGRDGKIAGRFLSAVTPDSAELATAIEAELAKK